MRTIKLLGLLLMLLPISIFAQSTVSGTVVDDIGMPVPGVNIAVKNTTKGTTTDFDGNFSIVLESGETLSFSYVGYRTQEVTFDGNNTTIDISLVEDAQSLNEVVVVGYGDQTVKSISGSVASVTEKDFNKGNIGLQKVLSRDESQDYLSLKAEVRVLDLKSVFVVDRLYLQIIVL